MLITFHKKAQKFLFIGSSLILLSGCAKTVEIQGEPPVAKLTFYKHWIEVFPMENTNLSDFVDMKIFGKFHPEMTFQDAVSSFGMPDNIRQKDHNTYYEYWTDDARIEVGREEYANGDGVGVEWALYSYPTKDLDYAELMPKAITKHIDPTQEETVVTIRNQSDEAAVLVDIKGRRVDHLNWFRIYQ